MKPATISAKVPQKVKDGKVVQEEMSATISVNYPETLEEAKKWCGEEAILSNAFANWRVVIQGGMRNALKAGKTMEQIQDQFKASVMGVATSGGRVDPQQAFIAKFKAATKEEQAKMLDDLKKAASQ